MADRAVRISFAHRDGDISIQSATVVSKRAPAGIDAGTVQPGTGTWLELHDESGVIYRRLVTSQFERDVEVFGGGGEKPFAHVTLDRPSEVDITVPLPTDRDAKKVRLVIIERSANSKPTRSSSAKRGRRRKTPEDEGAERRRLEIGLNELIDMPREEN